MKKLMLIISLAFLVSCGKDDDNNPSSNNNNNNNNNSTTYTTMDVTNIQITSLNLSPSWDALSGPDVFIQIKNSTGTIFTSSITSNATSTSVPISIGVSGVSLNSSDSYTLEMYDEDSPDADDIMCSTTLVQSSYRSGTSYNNTYTYSASGFTLVGTVSWHN